jgi:hypothetical protein
MVATTCYVRPLISLPFTATLDLLHCGVTLVNNSLSLIYTQALFATPNSAGYVLPSTQTRNALTAPNALTTIIWWNT